jgi:hypothetical protein
MHEANKEAWREQQEQAEKEFQQWLEKQSGR